MSFDHDNPLCASLGHFIAAVTVVYCPHRGEWLTYTRVGDESDDVSWRCDSTAFGPFDSRADVEAHVLAEARRALRADHSAWLARQAR